MGRFVTALVLANEIRGLAVVATVIAGSPAFGHFAPALHDRLIAGEAAWRFALETLAPKVERAITLILG